MPEVNPAEVAECGNVIQSVFTRLISQVELIGDQVHSKHSLQTRRRASIPHLRVMRFDQCAERSPRNKRFHPSQKRRLVRRTAVNLKPFNCCQCYFLHRIPFHSQNYLSDHMTNESFTTYSVFP